MRNLFASERRCISNMSRMKWGHVVEPEPSVLREYYSEPVGRRGGRRFNCDFALEFVDRFEMWPESMATAASILPNALGAEVFLIVEKATLSPMALELVGGDAFSIKHYASLIDVVEAAIQQAMKLREVRRTGPPWRELVEFVSIEEAAFARLLVVGSDITFLYSPSVTTPVMRGQRFNFAQADDREIDCYLDGKECVCFDGWIRTESTTSERVLVSLPRNC
jgi:hypothetical protein